MNLKELKKIIAEEYSAYTQKVTEQGAPKINVNPSDISVGEKEDAEATLKDIYEMLKDFFEGDDAADNAADDAADDTADDKADDAADDEAGDIEEGKHNKDGKSKSRPTLEAHCYDEDGKPMPEGHCYEEDGSLKEGYSKKETTILQERFQKLANIIK